jgi:hypothetical protein
MDAKHGLLFRVNNNYTFSNKVLRKVLGTMKADVGNLCMSDCGYNDYLAYARCSGNKMQVFWDVAASIVKVTHISEKLASPIFLGYFKTPMTAAAFANVGTYLPIDASCQNTSTI